MSDSENAKPFITVKYEIDIYNNIVCVEEGHYSSLNEAIDRADQLREEGLIVICDNKIVYPIYE